MRDQRNMLESLRLLSSHMPMSQDVKLIQLLSDGRFHSGEELGSILGVSRAAVWKMLRSFAALGLCVQAVPAKGYRLQEPLELLDGALIQSVLSPRAKRLLSELELLSTVDSTNRHAQRAAAQGAKSGYVCIAEHQSAGRGRRGRTWISPFGANLYLSVYRRFHLSFAALAGLSLAVGVAVLKALHHTDLSGMGLKWPNDILWEGRKLGGVLVELTGEASGPCDVVVGVGLNVRMPKGAGEEIEQPWVDVRTIAGGRSISRNHLGGLVLQELLTGLEDFEQLGFEGFRADWLRWDLAKGKEVELRLNDKVVYGRALGIDSSGALLLDERGTVHTYNAGEVTLRVRDDTVA